MSETKKARKVSVRHEGERFRVTLKKGDDRLSFSASPSATGYTLRARSKSADGLRVAVEQFAEAQYGDSFAAAKKRALELTASATTKGWSEKRKARSIEDLL
jgi:hypothetical protein